MNGWILLHRKIFKNPIFLKPELLQLFIYCLLKANHEQTKIIWNGKEMTIEIGQFITGRKILSQELEKKESTIRDRMALLKNLEFIDIKTNNRFSLVTVINYELYQQKNKNPTANPTTSRQLADTNNNINNINNINKKDLVAEVKQVVDPLPPEKIYQENIGLLQPHIADRIKCLIEEDGIEEQLLNKYILIAVERNARNWEYIEKMALGNLAINIKTLEQYNANQVEWNAKKGNKGNIYKQGKRTFDHDNQRPVTEDLFDKLAANLNEEDKKG
jgi:DnaD/phage-associated family protein